MRAMVLRSLASMEKNSRPLRLEKRKRPEPGPGQLLIQVSACGVCHTELDEIEGRTPPSRLPRILGHQVVGRVREIGPAAKGFLPGDRVGAAWIFSACGECEYCRSGRENLCPEFRATGRDADGGYAEYMVLPAAFAHPIPDLYEDAEAAPLLCAGAVGYRSLRLAEIEDGDAVGLTGFGASSQLVMRMIRHRFPASEVCVFARSLAERETVRELGAAWAGDSRETAPLKLRAVIDTTPAWLPLREALRQLLPGGRLVINAIRKEEGDKDALLRLDYATHLWQEKEIKSVANVTRRDVREFLELAAAIPIHPEIRRYPLREANRALLEMKNRSIRGAKVLDMSL